MNTHQICEEAEHTRCVCHCAATGQPCVCDPPKVCLRRFARARRLHHITGAQFAYIIPDGLDETGGVGFVIDPGAAA
jgi:hypothetical protein